MHPSGLVPHLVKDAHNNHVDFGDVIHVVDALVQPAHHIDAGLHPRPRRHCMVGRLRAMRSDYSVACMHKYTDGKQTLEMTLDHTSPAQGCTGLLMSCRSAGA